MYILGEIVHLDSTGNYLCPCVHLLKNCQYMQYVYKFHDEMSTTSRFSGDEKFRFRDWIKELEFSFSNSFLVTGHQETKK